jgi:hypothetical protein
MICSEGMIDLWNGWYGYNEITEAGIESRNVLFRNFEEDGTVSGYGMSSPGKLARLMQRRCSGDLNSDQLDALLNPFSLGMYTTLVCECAALSLDRGGESAPGVTSGIEVDPRVVLEKSVGDAAADYYS